MTNMMQEPQEHRKHERFPANGHVKVYTSVSNIGYTVSLKNISRDGAFIQTKQLPQAGETITFQILDEDGSKQYTGHGQVVWVHGSGPDDQLGFAIQLNQELTPAEEHLLLCKNSEHPKKKEQSGHGLLP